MKLLISTAATPSKAKRRYPSTHVYTKATVPSANKEKIQALRQKKKDLEAKHKAAILAIDKKLAALGFKPSEKRRRIATK